MPGNSDFTDVLEMFRDIHTFVRRVRGEVLVFDDPVERTLGFAVREGAAITGRWKFPLTRLRGSFVDIEDKDVSEQLSNLFRTAAGRAELAGMLTHGVFPGA